MAVYFTFAASKAHNSVPCAGDSISLADLKDAIAAPLVAALKGRKLKETFGLRVYDCDTQQEIVGANTRVRKNASVLVKRVPFFQQRLVAAQSTSGLRTVCTEEVINDGFGEDIFSSSTGSGSSGVSTVSSVSSKKVENLVHRNSSKRVEVPRKEVDKIVHNESRKTSKNLEEVRCSEIPVELRCTLCKNIMKDPVLIPCCCNSFCSNCIRVALAGLKKCPNCQSFKCGDADLLPNRHVNSMIHGYFKSNRSASNVMSSSGSNSSQTTSQTTSSHVRVADLQPPPQPSTNASSQKMSVVANGVGSGLLGKRKPLVISLNRGPKQTRLMR